MHGLPPPQPIHSAMASGIAGETRKKKRIRAVPNLACSVLRLDSATVPLRFTAVDAASCLPLSPAPLPPHHPRNPHPHLPSHSLSYSTRTMHESSSINPGCQVPRHATCLLFSPFSPSRDKHAQHH
jgi:hypothetical protein